MRQRQRQIETDRLMQAEIQTKIRKETEIDEVRKIGRKKSRNASAEMQSFLLMVSHAILVS